MKVSDLLRAIKLSRPLFWIYTGGLFILGAVVGADTSYGAIPWTSVGFLCVWVWFAVGENFFGVLINDYYDRDIDAGNPRKSEYWDPVIGYMSWGLVILSGGAFGVLLVGVGGAMLWVYGFIFFLCTFLYNVPPVRLKGRPPFDIIIGPACALPPLFAGYSLVTHTWPSPFAAVAGVFLFGGLELLDKLFDAEADRKAGLRTTATVLGWQPPHWLSYRALRGGLIIIGTAVASYAWYIYFS